MMHLLFVDENAGALRELERVLQGLRREWKLDFVTSIEEAKEALRSADLDVLVTQGALANDAGVEVLAFARECSPKTVRLVLAGQGEPALGMKYVGLAHQCLAAPVEPTTLRQVVARVTAGGFALRNERVMSLVAKLKHLPSLPTIYLQLVRLMNDPSASMQEVGNLIASDMAMTAKVLQIVNSSFFGLARHIHDPSEAASYLGIYTVKALVLAADVFAQYEKRPARDFSASVAARHSQQVGSAARAIAQTQNATPLKVDQSLVAGLLHDIGKMLLASNFPEEFQRAHRNPHVPPLEAEREVFGANHAEIGGYLLGLWGLPPGVVEAVRFHHAPAESGEREFTALTAVHVANCLVAEIDPATPAARRGCLDMAYLEGLGLEGRLTIWRAAVKKTQAVPA